jgi:hypothetical protein
LAVSCIKLNAHFDIRLLLQEKCGTTDTKMQTKNVNINQAALNNSNLEVSQPLAAAESRCVSVEIGHRHSVGVWINPSEVFYCIG